MNNEQRNKFSQFVNAILNAKDDTFREEKLIFAEEILKCHNPLMAMAIAVPNLSLEDQFKKGINSFAWETDSLVVAAKALLRVACPELLRPSREEMISDVRAAAFQKDCRPLDQLRLHRLAAEILGYTEAKPQK